ncbi:hypothetical protein CO683_41175 [Bradyrhizobium ottawaense]|nr:hypothetical protein CO683_41175 [Bradyrhizobium ottawaense]
MLPPLFLGSEASHLRDIIIKHPGGIAFIEAVIQMRRFVQSFEINPASHVNLKLATSVGLSV